MGEVVRLRRARKTRPKRSRQRGIPPWQPLVVLLGMAAVVYLMTLDEPRGGPVTPPISNELVGIASVIDGDTIEIHGRRIRLFGIDAPEGSQQCRDDAGASYRCGGRATLALDDMVRGKTVHCEQHDTDRYGRAVATCTADGVDLNGALVEAGLAVAYRDFSHKYVPNEERAKAARRGLWAGSFDMPWDHRRER